jgi:ribosomal protein S18 acetylase RimI-like enzyme
VQLWAAEDGALWALEPGRAMPAPCEPRATVAFAELGSADIHELAAALGQPHPGALRARLDGRRRCFVLRAGGQIAAYGWATRGAEAVGELERRFNLRDDEAYIWDCGTLPAWRGRRLYSALVSRVAHQLAADGLARIWIGASLQNRPSISGIANAGFGHVLDLSYRRIFRLSAMWIRRASAARPLMADAYRLLIQPHELRIGRLVAGYRPEPTTP